MVEAVERGRQAKNYVSPGRPVAHTKEAKASAQRTRARTRAGLQHLLLQHRRTAPRLAAPQQSRQQHCLPRWRAGGSSSTNTLKQEAVVTFGVAGGSKGTKTGWLAMLGPRARPCAAAEEQRRRCAAASPPSATLIRSATSGGSLAGSPRIARDVAGAADTKCSELECIDQCM